MYFLKKFLALITFCLLLAGCAPRINIGQGNVDDLIILKSGGTAGQTFFSRQAGLQAVDIYLRPYMLGDGKLSLHLRNSPFDSKDLAVTSMSLSDVNDGDYYRFRLPIQPDSALKDYYFMLELEGAGEVMIGYAPAGAYLDGSMYWNSEPIEKQMAFRLAFDTKEYLAGWLKQGANWLLWIGFALLALLVPGLALLVLWIPHAAQIPWEQKLCLAPALGLAIYPVLMLWLYAIHVQPGAVFPWLLIIPSLIILAIYAYRRRKPWKTMLRGLLGWVGVSFQKTATGVKKANLVLLLVTALLFLVRFYGIRPITVPLWADSYQHTMMTQLIVDNNGLFQSWLPYVPYETLTTQFGFSLDTAAWMWLTNMNSLQATLVFGQIVNVIAILALYPLILRLTNGNRWAGILGIIVAGFLNHLPAYYVNWGRFPQLTGQAVLPVLLWLTWELLESKPKARWLIAPLTALTLTGLLLCYYRMAFFYAAFMLVFLLTWAIPSWKRQPRKWLQGLLALAGTALLAFLFILPWLQRVGGGVLSSNVEQGLSSLPPLDILIEDYKSWLGISGYVPLYLLILAGIGWIFSLVQRKWPASGILPWFALLAAIPAGALIHLPGARMMQSFATLIALYIPVSILVGWLGGWLLEKLEIRFQRLGGILAALVLAVLACYSAYGQKGIVQPIYNAFVTQPDVRAMTWINQNTEPNALFLVEAYSIYEGSSVVGTDGGWWMPLIAGRANTIPPQYALANEVSDPPEYSQNVIKLVTNLEKDGVTSPAGLARLCEWGVSHIYVGQRQGLMGFGATQLFSADILLKSRDLERIYHQDCVSIFSIKPSVCTTNQ